MKRILSVLLFGVFFTLPCAYAEDFLRIEGAATSLSGYKEAYAAGFAWGRDLPHLLPRMSAEVEFLKGFTKLRGANTLSFSKTAGFAAFTFPVDRRISVKGKVGLRYATFDASSSGQDNDLGVDFGFGALFTLDRARRISAEYISSDDNNFSQFILGLQFVL